MNEIFLDTETTGLSFKSGHKVVEIACIETKDLIPTKKMRFCDYIIVNNKSLSVLKKNLSNIIKLYE